MKKIDVSIKYIVLDEPAKKFLQSLKAMRKKAGLTQQALADAVSIDSQSISYYENGHRLPLIATLNKLAEYFRI